MALNEISYDGKVYADEDIAGATGYRKSTIVGDELVYDTFEAEVWDYSKPLDSFTYGAPVIWTHRGNLMLKQYLESVKRTGKYKYLLSCVSGIGLIAKSRHYGGLYENVPFSTVLADVIGGVFPYTVDTVVASINVYGWLPVDNRRNNLRKLLTATGAVVRTNADGSVRFAAPDTTSPTEIKDQDIFMGGSVDNPTLYKAVKVTEHAYAKTPNDILTTLLDGEAAGATIITPKGVSVTGALITFSDPMHDLAVTGSTVLESGVNYAVLAPSMACTLTGYKYSHTTRVVTAGSLTASEQATKRLDDCTLVNALNVDSVAQRWLEFYSSQKTVSMASVWRGEQPADAAIFSDPYDTSSAGMIESQDVRLSAKVVADTTVQVGKIPSISGNTYDHVLVVTQSGSITIPAEAKDKVQLVLISGGPGGSSGYAGEVKSGTTESTQRGTSIVYRMKYYYPPGPTAGGKAGEPGHGARILRVTLSDIVAGQTTLNVSIGEGGKGGLFANGENSPGQSGGDTTAGAYTTAGAPETTTGYYDPINGKLYGAPGGAGIPGGAGGGFDENADGQTAEAESVAGFGKTFSGGTSVGTKESKTSSSGDINGTYGYKGATAFGSYGGGAAYGAPGGNGTLDGASASTGRNYARAKGAPGGAGATALSPPTPTNPGTGGYGGNGGGGAGACGGAYVENNYSTSPAPTLEASENTMTAGNGSDGGDGAPGVLLIYY